MGTISVVFKDVNVAGIGLDGMNAWDSHVVINYHSGVVTSTRKQKETQIHSSTQYRNNQPITSTSPSI
jgi:hypothetical protein